jgi:hypothetical protein
MEKKELTVNIRAYNHIKKSIMVRVEDALIELITNVDDAYIKTDKKEHLIDLEFIYPSTVIVRDHAIGMDADRMQKCFLQVGAYTSDDQSRGFFSRGAKDISALGDVTFEAIKDGKYSKCILDSESYGGIEIANIPATNKMRASTKIPKNGLQVTLDLLEDVIIPKPDDIKTNVPKLVSLRNIFANPKNKIMCTFLNHPTESSKIVRLKYNFPKADLLLDMEYEVPGYNGATAMFTLYKCDEPLPVTSDPLLQEYGLIFASGNQIHEINHFGKHFKYNQDLRYFFGIVYTNKINNLLITYDPSKKDKKNPFPIVNPNRTDGLHKKHPFVKNMLGVPLKRLQLALDDMDEENDDEISLDITDFSDIVKELNITNPKLDIDKNVSIMVSDPKSKLIKAIENERGKWVKIEKNYSIALKKLKKNNIASKNSGKESFESHGGVSGKISWKVQSFSDEPTDEDDIYKIYRESEDGIPTKLYIYDRLSEKHKNEKFESVNCAKAKTKSIFDLYFKDKGEKFARYVIKRGDDHITITVNIGHPVIKEQMQIDDGKVESISKEGLVLLHDVLSDAFTRLVLQQLAEKEENVFITTSSIDTLTKVYETYDSKSNMIEKVVYNIVNKLIKSKAKSEDKEKEAILLKSVAVEHEISKKIIDEKELTISDIGKKIDEIKKERDEVVELKDIEIKNTEKKLDESIKEKDIEIKKTKEESTKKEEKMLEREKLILHKFKELQELLES